MLFDTIKEKLAKEEVNNVQVILEANDYSKEAIEFNVKVNNDNIKDMLEKIARKYNKKNPNKKEITISDVFTKIIEKALLEYATYYSDTTSYLDLHEEVLAIQIVNMKLNYLEKNFIPEYERNKKLTAEVKSVNDSNEVLLAENEKLKSELDSIKKIVNKE